MLAAELPPAPIREDAHGVLRVAETRVSLESVATAFDRGVSAEEIVESYPVLELADVYGVLTYVLHNRVEVDAYVARRRAASEDWDGRVAFLPLRQ